MIKSKH